MFFFSQRERDEGFDTKNLSECIYVRSLLQRDSCGRGKFKRGEGFFVERDEEDRDTKNLSECMRCFSRKRISMEEGSSIGGG